MRSIGVLLAVGAALAATHSPGSGKGRTSREFIQEASRQVKDPHEAERAERAIRARLAEGDANEGALRQLIVNALIARRVPCAAIVAAADSACLALRARHVSPWLSVQEHVAASLVDRGECLSDAQRYASSVLSAATNDDIDNARSARRTLARIFLSRGHPESTVAVLSRGGIEDELDFSLLGQAHSLLHNDSLAMEAYIQSLGAFACSDSSAWEPLRTLYRKRFGTEAGLDMRIAAARGRSRQKWAIDAARSTGELPPISLPVFGGGRSHLRDRKEEVLVLTFWGTWCAPCAEGLPRLQELCARYADEEVSLLSVAWEHRQTTPNEIGDFLRRHSLTFPVLLDHDKEAIGAFGIDTLPTTLIVDRRGAVRFRNEGYRAGKTDLAIRAQIETLLARP
jgi:thiol-disulfide isomerase/thioredoxin